MTDFSPMKDHRCRGCGFALLPHVKEPWCLVCAPPELRGCGSGASRISRGLWDELVTAALFGLVVLMIFAVLASICWSVWGPL